MKHIIPSFLWAADLNGALAFCNEVVANANNPVVCDASHLKFVDPAGLCLLAVTCNKLSITGKRLELLNVPKEILGYLARMDLFKACGIEFAENFVRHDKASDLVEISRVESRATIELLADKIAFALAGRTPDFDPNAKPDEMSGYLPHEHVSHPLRYIFSELLENSLTHGAVPGYRGTNAWVAAQYYPKKDIIRLAVIDDGCGFLGSLIKHHKLPEKTHEAATRLALLPRITRNPDYYLRPQDTANQGFGLTVVKEVVLNSRGSMQIISGDCRLRLTANREYAHPASGWGGVILALELSRKYLRQLKIHEIVQKLIEREQKIALRFE